jgi:motility quorum-sensing regulator/GCU-specific mRNA interferase toxin
LSNDAGCDVVDKYTFKVYLVTVKGRPHHPLEGIKAKFAQVDTLEITTSALRGAQVLGYDLEAIVEVVQQLEEGDFIKSETAHNPRNHRVWHDSYRAPFDGYELYLKFAGETLIDVVLVSFKEA